MTRPSSPFQIHVSPELARPWLPGSTVDAPKMSPFANHIMDVLMGNASRTLEKDPDGRDLVWMVIQDPDRFTFEDIRGLFDLAKQYDLLAYVWHWPAFTIVDEIGPSDTEATLLGDKYLLPLKEDDGEWMNGHALVEFAESGNVVLSRREAEQKRGELDGSGI